MGQWGRAYLRPRETDIGRIRTLICGENTNALARFALRGELVHIANYPPAWPFHRFRADAHNYNLTEAIRIRSAAHAFEGKVCNVSSSCALDADAIDQLSRGDSKIKELLQAAPAPVSMFIGPNDEQLADAVIGAKAWLWPRSTRLIAPCGSEARGVATNSRLTSRLRAHKTRAS